jgi:hypothetical protein
MPEAPIPADDDTTELARERRKTAALERAVVAVIGGNTTAENHERAAEAVLRVLDPTAMSDLELAAAWSTILYCRRRYVETVTEIKAKAAEATASP